MPDTRDFYTNTSLDALEKILGKELHYHYGLYENQDTDYEDAQRKAVQALMRFIPLGGSVLDLGCGWGGPAAMLKAENGNKLLCVTNSPQQSDIVSKRDLNVIEHDLSQGLPETILQDRFDVALMMESYSHISNREALLTEIPLISKRLILRVNCTSIPHPPGFLAFGGTMRMPTPDQLLLDVKAAGWRPIMIRDVRMKTLKTITDWHHRLQKAEISGSDDHHLRSLAGLCQYAMKDLQGWGRSSPLIELVAERL